MDLVTAFWIVSALAALLGGALGYVTAENERLKDHIATFDHDGDGRIGGSRKKVR